MLRNRAELRVASTIIKPMQPTQTAHQEQRSPLYQDKTLLIIFAISLIAFLGVASVAPAFPKVSQALNIPPQKIGLLVSAFTFPALLFSTVAGVLADRVGRKNVIVPSLFLFGITGAACAFAADFSQLLWLRFFQGVGAAALRPLTITVISDLYGGVRRTTALGYNSTVVGVATCSYLILGGLLADIGWNYPFLMSLAAIPVGLLVLFALKKSEPQQKIASIHRSIDREILKCLSDRQLLAIFLSSTILYTLLFGVCQVYLPILLVNSFQASSSMIGFILSSISISIAIAASQSGRLSQRFSKPALLNAAFGICALALVIIPFMPHFWLLCIPTILFGLGFGIGWPMTQALNAAIAPPHHLATIFAIDDTFGSIGRTIGPLLMGFIFSFGGVNGVFFAGFGLAIITFMIVKCCVHQEDE